MTRRSAALVSIVLLIVSFLALNVASDNLLRGTHLDLTHGQLYTLSPGTKHILSKLDEPITLRLYFSEKLSAQYETVNSYGQRVRNLLRQFASHAHGNLKLEFVDPEPYSADEEMAESYGLTGAQSDAGDKIFLGLVGTNEVDGKETIPFISPDREVYLEYDLASLISRLATPEKPKLGLLSSLPLDTGPGGYLAMLQGKPAQPYVIYEQLKQSFDIQPIDKDVRSIPDDVQVLMIAQPPELSQQALYAIDQFALHGGRILLFLDPFSESSATGSLGGRPMPDAVISGDLPKLLAAWGVDYKPSDVVLDKDLATPVQYGQGDQAMVMPYLAWLRVTSANLDKKDLLTASVDTLQIASPGAVAHHEGASTVFTPLVWTSKSTQRVPAMIMQYGSQPDQLLQSFKSDGKSYVIAARVSGPISTAFPDGPPPPSPPKPPDPATGAPATPPEPPAPLPPQIKASEAPFNLVVIADTDMLEDRYWVNVQDFLGQKIAQPTAGNGAFVVGAVDQLMGSDDLISLRSRSRSERPFVVVQDIERKAQDKYQAEQQRLQAQIDETEQRLKELQSQPKQAGTLVEQQSATPMLSPAQEQEVHKFEAQLAHSQRALREVQRDLRADVITLGNWVKTINVALMPIIVAAGAILLAILRRQRRIAARLAAAKSGG